MKIDDEMVKTGMEGLDELLGGGIPYGRVALVSGSSGTGKTTFGVQFIYHGTKMGEPGLFITLEENKEKIISDMKGLGMDIEAEKDFNIIGGPVAQLLHTSGKSGANLKDFIREIKEVIEETGAKRVVLDSINLFLMLFKNDEERRKALLSLIELLGRMNCTALLTCEVRENSYDLSWYGFEEFVVDGVITLYNMRQESSFLQGITVRKMRGVKHQKNIVPYAITSKGIIVYPQQPLFGLTKKRGV
ncbi:MAG: RAD55 family ATPase [Candidatus Aenigmatarchaeota archaeon]